MSLKRYIRYFFWLISIIIVASLLHGCGGAKTAKKPLESKKMKIANKKDKGEIKKEKALEKKKKPQKKKIAKKKVPEKKGITIGKTTKAYLIANYGKPDKLFWSKEAEEILIYDKIKEIGKNVIIFISNKGVVKHITTFSKK